MATMTCEVIAFTRHRPYAAAMHPLTALRQQRRLSQLELGLRAGVSQRHLSCIETGRARPSRATLMALLDALDAPLGDRNDALLAAGLAPAYTQLSLDAPGMAHAQEALKQLLHAPGSPPVLVMDAQWNLVMVNAGVQRLLQLLELPMPDGQPNLLEWMLSPDGLRSRLVNEAEVCAEVYHRALRESAHVPALAERLRRLAPQPLPAEDHAVGGAAPVGQSPMLLTRLRARCGELALFSVFSSFGAPLDVTLASLRLEHLFAADEATRQALQQA
jgi:transcriptional regulator with XRE-family HTH domain